MQVPVELLEEHGSPWVFMGLHGSPWVMDEVCVFFCARSEVGRLPQQQLEGSRLWRLPQTEFGGFDDGSAHDSCMPRPKSTH